MTFYLVFKLCKLWLIFFKLQHYAFKWHLETLFYFILKRISRKIIDESKFMNLTQWYIFDLV